VKSDSLSDSTANESALLVAGSCYMFVQSVFRKEFKFNERNCDYPDVSNLYLILTEKQLPCV
jgi:hypothetical protein